MKEKKRKIIEKIQKILIKAKDQEGTPEGDTFKRHAALLMAQYRIEETEIDLKTDNFVLDTFEFHADNGHIPQWPHSLVSMFCYTFDVKCVFRTYKDRKEWEIIGSFSDVETTIYFIEIISAHIEKSAWDTWNGKRHYKKRNQFGNVATNVVWGRLYELKQQMDSEIHENEGCTALVLKKAEEVENAVNALYPNARVVEMDKDDMPTDTKTIESAIKAGESAPLNFAIENN